MYGYWFNKENTGQTLASGVFNTAEALVAEQSGIRQRMRRNLGYYLRRDVPHYGDSLGLIDSSELDESLEVLSENAATGYNVCRILPDALISRITLRQPIPSHVPTTATEETQARAASYDRFTQHEFKHQKTHSKARRSLRFSTIFGSAVNKVWPDHAGRRVRSRVYSPDKIIVDNRASTPYEQPLTMMHADLVDKGELLAMFPGAKNSAARALIDEASMVNQLGGIRQLVEVIEAYRLSTPDGPGRRVVVLRNGTLVDKPFDSKRHWFALENYREPIGGIFGEGLVDEVWVIQQEIDYIIRELMTNLRVLAPAYFLNVRRNKITDADLTDNKRYKIMDTDGGDAKAILNEIASPSVLALLDLKKREAFESTGLNQLSATATLPAGLESGEAQRVYNATQTQRFSEIENMHGDMLVEVGELQTLAAKELHAAGSYDIADKRIREALPFVGGASQQYTLTVAAASGLSDDPGGRRQEVNDAARQGIITREEARSLWGLPDLDKVVELDNAPRDLLEHLFEQILTGEITEPVAPNPAMMDMAMALRLGTAYWNRAYRTGTEQERLDLLEEFVTEVAKIVNPPPVPPPIISEQLPGDPGAALQLAQAQSAVGAGQPGAPPLPAAEGGLP